MRATLYEMALLDAMAIYNQIGYLDFFLWHSPRDVNGSDSNQALEHPNPIKFEYKNLIQIGSKLDQIELGFNPI